MSITVIFNDRKLNYKIFDVDSSITIGELRKLYESDGGEQGLQMKINAIIVDENKRLKDYIIRDKIKKITISVVYPVRGGGN